MKNKHEERIRRKSSHSYLHTWGCLAKVNVPINKNRKLRPKTVDCCLLAYAYHSLVYRFLVIKLGVTDVWVNTFLKCHDVTSFKNIFHMKYLHNMSRLPTNVIVDTTFEPFKKFEHAEHTLD
jgi:hypothetical protein